MIGAPSGGRLGDDSRVLLIKMEKMRNKYFNDTTNYTLLKLTKMFEGIDAGSSLTR